MRELMLLEARGLKTLHTKARDVKIREAIENHIPHIQFEY